MKILKYLLTTFCCGSLVLTAVNASGDGFISVTSEQELKECLESKSACKLEADISVSSVSVIDGNVILDLNGHSIVPDANLKLKTGLLFVDKGGKLTIHDSKNTGKISTGDSGNVWAAIQLVKNDNKEGTAELVLNSGTLEGYYYGIVGNGNNHNTKITINGGEVNALNKDDSAGIYNPQKGEIEINGGTISGGTGIEIRSGSLTIKNGTIKGISPTFNRAANSNGTTTNGSGITVAQHKTKNPINVLISGGNISGQYAFYEWNPQNNDEVDINKVKIKITGGDFTSTINDGYAVYSEDFTKFITGGKFNTEVSEYLADDASVITTMAEDLSIKTNSPNKIIYIALSLLILGCTLSYTLYKKGLILNKYRNY